MKCITKKIIKIICILITLITLVIVFNKNISLGAENTTRSMILKVKQIKTIKPISNLNNYYIKEVKIKFDDKEEIFKPRIRTSRIQVYDPKTRLNYTDKYTCEYIRLTTIGNNGIYGLFNNLTVEGLESTINKIQVIVTYFDIDNKKEITETNNIRIRNSIEGIAEKVIEKIEEKCPTLYDLLKNKLGGIFKSKLEPQKKETNTIILENTNSKLLENTSS